MGNGIILAFAMTPAADDGIFKWAAFIAEKYASMFLEATWTTLYAMSALKDKKEFRATLNAVWVVTGTLWMGYDFILGNYTEANVIRSLVGISTLAISIPVGNFLFRKLNQQKFLKLTYVLVILAGVTMLL